MTKDSEVFFNKEGKEFYIRDYDGRSVKWMCVNRWTMVLLDPSEADGYTEIWIRCCVTVKDSDLRSVTGDLCRTPERCYNAFFTGIDPYKNELARVRITDWWKNRRLLSLYDISFLGENDRSVGSENALLRIVRLPKTLFEDDYTEILKFWCPSRAATITGKDSWPAFERKIFDSAPRV